MLSLCFFFSAFSQTSSTKPNTPTNQVTPITPNTPLKTVGCVEGDCLNGAGKYLFDNGDKFNGYWANGIRNDYGRYDWKNGDFYLGDFRNDMIEGKGAFHFASGKIISGEWANGDLIKVDKPEDSASLHMKLKPMQMKK